MGADRPRITMHVTLNGKPTTLAEGITVRALLDGLDFAPVRVAVEINEDLVPRRTFEQAVIREGDTIEIVTFVGGGS
jgi:thiamine biosynthesis protein ThiS